MNSLQYQYKVAFFTITAKTPLHAGAGGENFWIVDNLVQRDSTTNLPCIYSTSLKGAIREYMRDYLRVNNEKPVSVVEGQESNLNNNEWIKSLFKIFGVDRSDTDLKEDELSKLLFSQNETEENTGESLGLEKAPTAMRMRKMNYPGEFRFFQADLLSIPILKDGHSVYKVSCEYLKNIFAEKLDLFNVKISGNDLTGIFNHVNDISDLEFCEKVDDYNLPVIARNHLEDGNSANLWYEQVLPRETKLFFPVLYQTEELMETFKKAIESNPVQIGANASVGYGFCKIKFIPTTFKFNNNGNQET